MFEFTSITKTGHVHTDIIKSADVALYWYDEMVKDDPTMTKWDYSHTREEIEKYL